MLTLPLDIPRTAHQYSVYLGQGLLPVIVSLLPHRPTQAFLVTHPRLYEHHGYGQTVQTALEESGLKTHLALVAEGETTKSWANAERLLAQMIASELDRRAVVLALGGGVIGDLAGLVASLYSRGIAYVQLPTTLLAMVDSSVGGKTAVNLGSAGKNLVGSFHQPDAVVADLDTLQTLPEKEWQNGLSEVLKYALLRDDGGEFFGWLSEHSTALRGRSDLQLVQELIRVSVQSKAEIVIADEQERGGPRALLNLGHTFGHALEAASHYQIPHGEGVSIGLVLAVRLSQRLELISAEVAEQIVQLIGEQFGLPTTIPTGQAFQPDQLLEHFYHDKKTVNHQLNFVLPVGSLGRAEVIRNVPPETVRQVLSETPKQNAQ